MFFNYFYNETQMRPLGGQGPAQSTIQAVHHAIQAQQQALQAQHMQHSYYPPQSYHSLQSYYPPQVYYPSQSYYPM
ncbi:hypothetical protein CN445_18525 [Bacillus cereus]|uniref:DUF3947 family protein n=1 Tax=Bacillus nitratireducens TaxID=2026193 RepID=A0ABU6PBH3_9BACI|nr:DUF3947 family protein [Bacillus nitratireducens]EJS56746.1 hypothetical protein ICG_02287 [Bacillus cereus BAG1X1-3]EOO73669.1 hypothetical protein IC7_02613 [Bacillus cereus BAG1O-1]OSX93204.1 hypothetical protein BTJ45_02115 [Bacillus mycoides]PDY23641.1 hypothetical protein COM83_12235 [Bacillus cereus]MDR4171691.1 DUF3947 family protein [Bacillus nitratireducens]